MRVPASLLAGVARSVEVPALVWSRALPGDGAEEVVTVRWDRAKAAVEAAVETDGHLLVVIAADDERRLRTATSGRPIVATLVEVIDAMESDEATAVRWRAVGEVVVVAGAQTSFPHLTAAIQGGARRGRRVAPRDLPVATAPDDEALVATVRRLTLPADVAAACDREIGWLLSASDGVDREPIRRYLATVAAMPWEGSVVAPLGAGAVNGLLQRRLAGLAEAKTAIATIAANVRQRRRQRGDGPLGLFICGPGGSGRTAVLETLAECLGAVLVTVPIESVTEAGLAGGDDHPGAIACALLRAAGRPLVIAFENVDAAIPHPADTDEPTLWTSLRRLLEARPQTPFVDNYLGGPINLSGVVVAVTSDELDSVEPRVARALEIVALSGYTTAEKAAMTRSHLWPAAQAAAGLTAGCAILEESAIAAMITRYTWESGVGALSATLHRLARRLVLEVERAPRRRLRITAAALDAYLSHPEIVPSYAARVEVAGAMVGLEVADGTGECMICEVALLEGGKGRVGKTGELGPVISESIDLAISLMRSRGRDWGVDPAVLRHHDIHVHLTGGSKDGSSAGCAVAVALLSALRGTPVATGCAITGAISLHGRVIPVGNVVAKVIGAHRHGLRRVVIPADNAVDVARIPEAVRAEVEIVLCATLDEVFDAVFEPAAAASESTPLGGGLGHPQLAAAATSR